MPGVIYNPPPDDLKPSLRNSIANAVAGLGPGKKVALVSLTNEHGTNAAIVIKVNDIWDVKAWIGKEWHDKNTQYGAEVKASW